MTGLPARRRIARPRPILALAVTLFASGAGAAFLLPRLEQRDQVELPAWASITTAGLAHDAVACYQREAQWQGTTYCASPINDIVEVVWASCFGEEQSLLLTAIEDADSDQAGMDYLNDLQSGSRAAVVSLLQDARAAAARCKPD